MISGTVIKSLVLVMAGLVLFGRGALAQKQGSLSPLKSLVATDPKPVNGKRWMQDHPLPPTQTSEKRDLLAWQPIFADVAEAGDLGYTTGPWEYKDDINVWNLLGQQR